MGHHYITHINCQDGLFGLPPAPLRLHFVVIADSLWYQLLLAIAGCLWAPKPPKSRVKCTFLGYLFWPLLSQFQYDFSMKINIWIVDLALVMYIPWIYTTSLLFWWWFLITNSARSTLFGSPNWLTPSQLQLDFSWKSIAYELIWAWPCIFLEYARPVCWFDDDFSSSNQLSQFKVWRLWYELSRWFLNEKLRWDHRNTYIIDTNHLISIM